MKRSRLQDIFIKIWESPTITTWGSFVGRMLSMVLVLPLVLNKFSTADITLWYLFLTIINLQTLADLGFGVTFVRVIAYGMGGANKLDDLRNVEPPKLNHPNWEIIEKIVSTMYHIYAYLTPLVFLLLIIAGSLSLLKPISYSENPSSAWISWILIAIVTTIVFRGAIYSNYLQGINQIPLLRRWQAIFSIGAMFTSFIVLWFDGSILELVIAHQSWVILNVIRNYIFCRNILQRQFLKFKKNGRDDTVLKAIWPSAWRSGLGVLMSYGVIQLSGLIYAQIGSVGSVASYLLALRILNNIRGLSQAPFYSKIPRLARLRAEGNIEKQISVARQGMILSYWVFALGFITIGWIATPLLRLIGSNAEFVTPLLWSLLGIGYFLERYGAMHIQLYSITNHIIWHIANGISGIIYLGTSLMLLKYIDVYAFPVGIILGYLGFYTWYSAGYSYRTFRLEFWEFEKKVMLIPFGVILLYSILITLI